MAGAAIVITAFIGVIINGLSAFLFYKGQKNDINIKGAFLHLLLDALVSVGGDYLRCNYVLHRMVYRRTLSVVLWWVS